MANADECFDIGMKYRRDQLDSDLCIVVFEKSLVFINLIIGFRFFTYTADDTLFLMPIGYCKFI